METLISHTNVDLYFDEIAHLRGDTDVTEIEAQILSIDCPLDTDTDTGFTDPPSIEVSC